MKPRVFVSSVIDGFEEYRAAARLGITEAGGDPVLIEDYPGLPVSPRNACLDAVESCDIFTIVIGSKGGWITPSGKLVVDEELEEAIRLKLPVLGFIQTVAHDHDAENLVKKLSDYIDGVYRLTFATPQDLTVVVEKTLSPIAKKYNIKPEVNKKLFQEMLKNPFEVYGQATLRFILSPERSGELIDPVSLDDQDFEDKLYEVSHAPTVRLFSYSIPKEKREVGTRNIVLLQTSTISSPGIFDEVRLDLATDGSIIIDLNVTGQRDADMEYYMTDSSTITEEDIAEGLKRCFAFANAFYAEKDPFKRYDRLLYNVSLNGISHRILIPKRVKMSSCQIPFNQDDGIIAFDKPRMISRTELESFLKPINDTTVMFKRCFK